MAEIHQQVVVDLVLPQGAAERLGAQAGQGMARGLQNIDFHKKFALGRISNDISQFNSSLEASNARVLAFGASMSIIGGVSAAFYKIGQAAVDTEKKLADINVVMNLGRQQLKQYGDELYRVAGNTGQSFEKASEAAANYARQGLDAIETMKRTRDALILSRLAAIDVKDAQDALTVGMNAYKKEAMDTTDMINRMFVVDTKAAVSAGDLAEALKRTGSVAADAGVSFNELISLVAAMQQATGRGGAVIGNALKSIFTRVQRPQTIQDLEDLGIAVRNSSGQVLGVMPILQNLAKMYPTLSQGQKQYVSEMTAGVFQINQLKAILGDLGSGYGVYARELKAAANTSNEAIERSEKLNETFAAQANKTIQTLTMLAGKVGTLTFTPLLKNLVGVAGGSSEGFSKLLDGEGLGAKFVRGIFKGIGTALAGPGLVLGGQLLLRLTAKLTQEAGGAVKVILEQTREKRTQLAIEEQLGNLYRNDVSLQQSIAAGMLNQSQIQDQMLQKLMLNISMNERLNASIATTAKAGAQSGLFNYNMISGLSVQKGRPVKNKAEGLIPAIAREEQAIQNGVGGATPSAKPVVKYINSDNGLQQVVVNSDEKIIRNFMGGGKDAVINKRLAMSMGDLGAYGQVEHAADGIVPNYAENISVQEFLRLHKENASKFQSVSFIKAGHSSIRELLLKDKWGLKPQHFDTSHASRALEIGQQAINRTGIFSAFVDQEAIRERQIPVNSPEYLAYLAAHPKFHAEMDQRQKLIPYYDVNKPMFKRFNQFYLNNLTHVKMGGHEYQIDNSDFGKILQKVTHRGVTKQYEINIFDLQRFARKRMFGLANGFIPNMADGFASFGDIQGFDKLKDAAKQAEINRKRMTEKNAFEQENIAQQQEANKYGISRGYLEKIQEAEYNAYLSLQGKELRKIQQQKQAQRVKDAENQIQTHLNRISAGESFNKENKQNLDNTLYSMQKQEFQRVWDNWDSRKLSENIAWGQIERNPNIPETQKYMKSDPRFYDRDSGVEDMLISTGRLKANQEGYGLMQPTRSAGIFSQMGQGYRKWSSQHTLSDATSRKLQYGGLGLSIAVPAIASMAGTNEKTQGAISQAVGGIGAGIQLAALTSGPLGVAAGVVVAGLSVFKSVLDMNTTTFADMNKKTEELTAQQTEVSNSLMQFLQASNSYKEAMASGDIKMMAKAGKDRTFALSQINDSDLRSRLISASPEKQQDIIEEYNQQQELGINKQKTIANIVKAGESQTALMGIFNRNTFGTFLGGQGGASIGALNSEQISGITNDILKTGVAEGKTTTQLNSFNTKLQSIVSDKFNQKTDMRYAKSELVDLAREFNIGPEIIKQLETSVNAKEIARILGKVFDGSSFAPALETQRKMQVEYARSLSATNKIMTDAIRQFSLVEAYRAEKTKTDTAVNMGRLRGQIELEAYGMSDSAKLAADTQYKELEIGQEKNTRISELTQKMRSELLGVLKDPKLRTSDVIGGQIRGLITPEALANPDKALEQIAKFANSTEAGDVKDKLDKVKEELNNVREEIIKTNVKAEGQLQLLRLQNDYAQQMISQSRSLGMFGGGRNVLTQKADWSPVLNRQKAFGEIAKENEDERIASLQTRTSSEKMKFLYAATTGDKVWGSPALVNYQQGRAKQQLDRNVAITQGYLSEKDMGLLPSSDDIQNMRNSGVSEENIKAIMAQREPKRAIAGQAFGGKILEKIKEGSLLEVGGALGGDFQKKYYSQTNQQFSPETISRINNAIKGVTVNDTTGYQKAIDELEQKKKFAPKGSEVESNISYLQNQLRERGAQASNALNAGQMQADKALGISDSSPKLTAIQMAVKALNDTESKKFDTLITESIALVSGQGEANQTLQALLDETRNRMKDELENKGIKEAGDKVEISRNKEKELSGILKKDENTRFDLSNNRVSAIEKLRSERQRLGLSGNRGINAEAIIDSIVNGANIEDVSKNITGGISDIPDLKKYPELHKFVSKTTGELDRNALGRTMLKNMGLEGLTNPELIKTQLSDQKNITKEAEGTQQSLSVERALEIGRRAFAPVPKPLSEAQILAKKAQEAYTANLEEASSVETRIKTDKTFGQNLENTYTARRDAYTRERTSLRQQGEIGTPREKELARAESVMNTLINEIKGIRSGKQDAHLSTKVEVDLINKDTATGFSQEALINFEKELKEWMIRYFAQKQPILPSGRRTGNTSMDYSSPEPKGAHN